MKTNTIHPYLLIFLWIPLLSNSQKSVFDLGISNTNKLPPMKVIIDDQLIARAYYSGEVMSSESYIGEEMEGQFYSSVYQVDKKADDAIALFSRYLYGVLLSETGNTSGEIIMKVVYYDNDHDWTIGSFFNVLTFGMGYLIGIPGNVTKTIVEIDLELYSNEMKKIAHYTGTGKKKCYDGLYFPKHDFRDVNLLALKEAIRSIHEQVMVDFDRLNKELNPESTPKSKG